jgi:hypothetical protein
LRRPRYSSTVARGGEVPGGEAAGGDAEVLLVSTVAHGGEVGGREAVSPRRRRPRPVGTEGRRRPHSGREGAENGWCVGVIYFCVARVS